MKISPLAGKPAPLEILVDVPRLITAYYTEVPDPSVPEQRVSFGTSGHRGSSFKRAFNEWHILAITQAICLYRTQQKITGPLYLGMDTHALSVPAGATALEVLTANGVEVMIAVGDEYTPTPVISHAILTYNRDRKTGLADGIVITPSHNPPHDGGFKYNPPPGGPADNTITSWIEATANTLLEARLQGVKRIPYEQALHSATTHRHDYLTAYVNDLGNVIDLDIIRSAKISLGVDPLGGAGVHYWARIAERHGLNLKIINETVDPTFRFMTVDGDGQIRMDPSSPYAIQPLIGMKDRFDLSFACDTDYDRHGIVTRSEGLLPPNHDLCVAIFYLFQNRPKWHQEAAIGKTVVSSQMIDRITAKLGRQLFEVPVGFKWFVGGLLDGSLGFAGEESAGSVFARLDGSVWTTDKDGFVPCLLAAEITARTDQDLGEIYSELTQEFGEPFYDRVQTPATPEQKEKLANLSPQQVTINELAGEKIQKVLTHAPGNGAAIGGLKVMTESGWFAARPSGTEDIYKIYAESFQGTEHLHHILENEGHAAFAILERARTFMNETGQPFEVALAVTRAGNLFTTHTAVAAGFDRFAPALIEQYLGRYAQDKLGITVHDLLSLGRQNPNDSSESFNMAYLAIRGSGAVNGVSRCLHGQVSRRIFTPLFPYRPEDEVPIGYVTNGVHIPSWESSPADDLWTGACGKDRWLGTTENLGQDIRHISDTRLWQFRTAASKSLVEYARQRLSQQLIVSNDTPEAINGANHLFSPNVLTLGFARRFATYKRPNLLLHDRDRLLRLLTNPQRPVQLIIAGKAHPADQGGQALIQEWVRFIRQPEMRPHAIFLSDYDMLLTEHLVQGVDVWINTPRRPWEACGTSGMKVLVNGGINLSELDGWWAEAYNPEVGWALGDGQEHGDDPAWDAVEANALYDLLEQEVIPEFYTRNDSGIPTAWVKRMRESMAQLTPRFSATHAVREYIEEYYLPAATAYRDRAANNGEVGKQIVDWQHTLQDQWDSLHFGEIKVVSDAQEHTFTVEVFFGSLDPKSVRVELYANGVNGGNTERQEMKRGQPLTTGNGYIFNTQVSATRLAKDYTARIIPHWDGVAIPLEEISTQAKLIIHYDNKLIK